MGIAIEHVRSITRLRHALRHIEKDTTHALITALSASAYKIPVFLAASEDDKLTKRPGMLEYAQALELSPQQFFTCTDG